jgi:hypothetical protein
MFRQNNVTDFQLIGWRISSFPEFRKLGNDQLYLSLAATTEETFTKRDSEARTLRTSLGCLSR